jgi:hypothetical protein
MQHVALRGVHAVCGLTPRLQGEQLLQPRQLARRGSLRAQHTRRLRIEAHKLQVLLRHHNRLVLRALQQSVQHRLLHREGGPPLMRQR